MPSSYTSIGATLAGLVNVERVYTLISHGLPSALTPLTGLVRRRTLSGRPRHDGAIDGTLQIDYGSRAALNNFMNGVFGGWTTPGVQRYLTLLDESGQYSPFLGYIEKPTFEVAPGGALRSIVFPLLDLTLQSVSKNTNATLTASERLVYADTSSGNITLTLPAASAVGAYTVVSVVKAAAANTLTAQRAGSDTLNGGTSVALTAQYARVDLVSDGVSKWTSL